MVNKDYYMNEISQNKTPYKASISLEQNIYSSEDLTIKDEKIKTGINSKIKILIVDDNTVNRFIMTKLLTMLGVSITEAASGIQAIELIKNNIYQIAFIDYLMPQMNGLELTKYINTQIDEKIRPKIICVSGKLSSEIQSNFEQAGASAVISKPIEIDQLRNVVSKIEPGFQNLNIHNQDILKEDFNYKGKNKNQVIYELLSNITELDYKKGLYYAINDEIIYMKIIEVSVVNLKQSIQRMNKDETEIRYLDLKREFHSLKSILMHIGAISLARNAEIIELRLENNQAINSNYMDKFVDDLSKLLAALEHAMDAYTIIESNENNKVKLEYNNDMDRYEEIRKRKQATIYHAKRFEYEMMLENIKVLQTLIGSQEEEIIERIIKAALHFEYGNVAKLVEKVNGT